MGRLKLAAGAAILIGLAAVLATALARGGSPLPPLHGTALSRAVPDLPLVDARGHTTSLRAFRGRVVVLAPTLTLCHEVCPITTGALLQLEHSVRAAGLGKRVVALEVSVDPWRDTPQRVRTYRAATGVDFPVLTGTHAQLERFWRFFGVGFYPTGRGKTFDVTHTDGVFVVDERGRWRSAIIGMPTTHGKLAPRLRKLLDAEGLRNLSHPQAPWTVQDALDDVGRLLGRKIEAKPLE